MHGIPPQNTDQQRQVPRVLPFNGEVQGCPHTSHYHPRQFLTWKPLVSGVRCDAKHLYVLIIIIVKWEGHRHNYNCAYIIHTAPFSSLQF